MPEIGSIITAPTVLEAIIFLKLFKHLSSSLLLYFSFYASGYLNYGNSALGQGNTGKFLRFASYELHDKVAVVYPWKPLLNPSTDTEETF